ncbi:MAG: diacylglycerol kinase [Neorhizobium sp.]|nr:diacylglycerol kinase [Neorhizobium sp.]
MDRPEARRTDAPPTPGNVPDDGSSSARPGDGAATGGDYAPGAPRATGFARIVAATRYSLQGMRRLWDEEAFRHEVIASAAGLILFALVGAATWQYLAFLILMLVLFAVEALNTAVEELVDRISPEISTVGRHAKDLGSFAVFALLTANGLFALYVVIENLSR